MYNLLVVVCLGTAVVNHLIYADNLFLFVPSAKGTLLNICYTDVSTTFNIMLVNPWSCSLSLVMQDLLGK